MGSAKEVLDKQSAMETVRSPFERDYRSIAKLMRPDDTSFNQAEKRTERDDGEIFDSTPLYAVDALSGGIFGQLTSPTNRWLGLAVEGDDDLNDYAPVKQHLFQRVSRILASVSPSVSQFYAEAPAWFADVGAFGMGTMAQEERAGTGRIADRTVPLGQSFIENDYDGLIGRFHNQFRWTGANVLAFFKGHSLGNIREDRDYVITHAVYQNAEANPRRLGYLYMPWRSCYVSRDIPDLFVEGGYNELPYHVLMWNKVSGRMYPTGPGHTTRADNWSLQEMERSHLVAAQFAAEPPLLSTDESLISAADVVPNAFLAGGLSGKGERLVDILERKQQLQLSLGQSQQKRQSIQTAFMFGLMQLIDRPQMTATEFLGFQEEVLRLSAPALTRIQIGLSGFIARRDRILQRAGLMPPAPPELAGRSLSIQYVSPLAKLQKVADAKGVLQVQAAIEQMAITDPNVRDNFDADVASRVVGAAYTDVPGLIRDPRAVAQSRQARAAIAQRDMQLDQAGKAVGVAAEAAHAMQAATLSQGRQPQK